MEIEDEDNFQDNEELSQKFDQFLEKLSNSNKNIQYLNISDQDTDSCFQIKKFSHKIPYLMEKQNNEKIFKQKSE